MKYDYTKEFAMIEKIPNLEKTFRQLKSNYPLVIF